MMRAIFTLFIMDNIVSFTKRVGDVSASEKEACFHLLTSQFLGIRRDDFERDFAEKEAVLFLSAGDAIVGFSTIMTLPLAANAVGIFSGDTAIDPRYRVSSGPLRELGLFFEATLERFPAHEIWYVLIAKGWRTYKLLPSLFRCFSPSPEPMPARERAIIEAFGAAKYPSSFEGGIIRAAAGAARVRPDSVDSVPARLDEGTEYFLRANPRYRDGDELVCVGRVTPENFAAPLRRVLSRHADVRC